MNKSRGRVRAQNIKASEYSTILTFEEGKEQATLGYHIPALFKDKVLAKADNIFLAEAKRIKELRNHSAYIELFGLSQGTKLGSYFDLNRFHIFDMVKLFGHHASADKDLIIILSASHIYLFMQVCGLSHEPSAKKLLEIRDFAKRNGISYSLSVPLEARFTPEYYC